MAIDLTKLDVLTKHQLHEAGHTDHDISQMSFREAFEIWCNYEGLIHYADTLIRTLDNIRAASPEEKKTCPSCKTETTQLGEQL